MGWAGIGNGGAQSEAPGATKTQTTAWSCHKCKHRKLEKSYDQMQHLLFLWQKVYCILKMIS